MLFVGRFTTDADFGAGLVASAGEADAFVVKLGPSGHLVWAKTLGGPDEDRAHDVAVNDACEVVVVGGFRGTADFGGGPITAAGGRDVFVAKYAP